MAVIEGQIEPLKKLKKVLSENGITRFNSISEINHFLKNYEKEKKQILKDTEKAFDREVADLRTAFEDIKERYEKQTDKARKQVNLEIFKLKKLLKQTKNKSQQSFLNKIFYGLKLKNQQRNLLNLEKNIEQRVVEKTKFIIQEFFYAESRLYDLSKNRDQHLVERNLEALQGLQNTKAVIDRVYNLIAGAVGENAVVKEIEKLSDDFHLFNDFSAVFDPPIYNKQEGDRIYSIQIDHLLVCPSGVFLLETKNWSKTSVKNIDLRSPVEQIKRSSYALFVLLNSASNRAIGLSKHHWGDKQIPVRNIIVMTNAKPKEKFNHVKVLSLEDLNKYITYFDPIFSDAEVKSICRFLNGKAQ